LLAAGGFHIICRGQWSRVPHILLPAKRKAILHEAIVLQKMIVHWQRSAFAKSPRLPLISRIALRRLRTQVASDHFIGTVVTAAAAVNSKGFSTEIPSPEFRERVDQLIIDLRHLIVETNTTESIDLSVAQLRGCSRWDSKDRYPSLEAFARDDKAQASFARAMSGQDVPALFEELLGKTDRTNRPLPKIYRRVWDNTYWWADAVCSRTLAALLWLCLARNIQFHFRGNLTLIDLNAAGLIRPGRLWQILLCTESVREAAKHVARTLRMPMVCLALPTASLGTMKGFDPDLVELRNQNALITDSLICFPADRSAGTPLINELVHRSDVIDVLANLPQLIEPLPTEHRDEPAFLASEPPREQYQLSLW
jgi:hypothetical protein